MELDDQEKAQQAEVLTSAMETEESTEVEISEAVEHLSLIHI